MVGSLSLLFVIRYAWSGHWMRAEDTKHPLRFRYGFIVENAKNFHVLGSFLLGG